MRQMISVRICSSQVFFDAKSDAASDKRLDAYYMVHMQTVAAVAEPCALIKYLVRYSSEVG